jgi:hypothetical protein
LWSTLGYWEKKNRRKEMERNKKLEKGKIYKKDLDFRIVSLWLVQCATSSLTSRFHCQKCC